MVRCWPLFLFPILLPLLGGCRSTSQLETELRSRDNDIYYLRAELDRAKSINQAMQMEVRGLKGEVPAGSVFDPYHPIYPMKSLSLGRQTGGIDNDGQPGDDSLQVMLEPKDADGHLVKIPGQVAITAFEITAEGTKNPLSAWQISPDDLARTWRNGLLTSGYTLVLPWKIWPTTNQIRVVAQFRMNDGRLFEAERDVAVRIPAGLMRRAPGVETIITPTPIPLPPPVQEKGLIPLPVIETPKSPPPPAPLPNPSPPLPLPVPNSSTPPPAPNTPPLPPVPMPNTNPPPAPVPNPTPPLPTPGVEKPGKPELPPLSLPGVLPPAGNLPPPGELPPPSPPEKPAEEKITTPSPMISSGQWRGVNTNPLFHAVSISKPKAE